MKKDNTVWQASVIVGRKEEGRKTDHLQTQGPATTCQHRQNYYSSFLAAAGGNVHS